MGLKATVKEKQQTFWEEMKKFTVTRTVRIPDLVRIRRYQRMPELGPQVLFFSGGSALTAISRELKAFTHNSIHLVTPFDSGGSSAKLRDAFDMPSIGDLRSRLMALADETIHGHPEVFRLFTYRLPANKRQDALVKTLDAMVNGKDRRVADIKNPMRRLICNHLGFFRDAMPKRFDLRGASIGNLILAGGYLNNHNKLDPIVFLFSRLVGVQGTVRTVLNDDLHLAAELDDGSLVVGQHRMTGKEAAPLDSPIKLFFLSRSKDKAVATEAMLPKKKRKLITGADLICFPPGSFYSSVVANLLPIGVGGAVAANDAPKAYLPSLGDDPEQIGMTLAGTVRVLLATLRKDAGADCPADRLLNVVLMDTKNASYGADATRRALRKLGVRMINTPLVSPKSAPYYDPQLVAAALLSLT